MGCGFGSINPYQSRTQNVKSINLKKEKDLVRLRELREKLKIAFHTLPFVSCLLSKCKIIYYNFLHKVRRQDETTDFDGTDADDHKCITCSSLPSR